MALSDDLRSVQAVLGEIACGNPDLVTLLRDNLQSIADQVEALEALPLPGSDAALPVTMLDSKLVSRSSGTYVQ